MISNASIRHLYRHARCPQGGFSVEFLQQVSEKCKKFHHLEFKDGFMIIGDMDNLCPFKRICISRIKGIEDLGDQIAIVLHSCIIFFNNTNGKININLRPSKKPGILSAPFRRIRDFFSKKCPKKNPTHRI